MLKKTGRTKRLAALTAVLEIVVVAAVAVFLKQNVIVASLILAVELILTIYLFSFFEAIIDDQSSSVKETLGKAAGEAFLSGGIGMVIYDDDYVITWMSDIFKERGIDRVGKKILSWIPEADDLIAGRSDKATVMLDERIYEIYKKEDASLIYFKDVTEINAYQERYEDERIVIGMASFDNYEESTQFADEAEIANISSAVRQPLTDYCKLHRILIKRLNNNRYLLVLNEKVFREVMADHFSVLTRVRRSAQKMDVSITLSMAFAKGDPDFSQLDEMVSNLMDLCETRGGDQVAVQEYGQEIKYYGGASEAVTKRSRVRVRVMSHTLRDLIQRSSNVIICGHKTADFDCIGSAVCLSRMATALHKNACVIAKSGGLEEKLKAALEENEAELKEEVRLVSENEALNQLQNNTLVIMTDHHSKKQSNGSKVLEAARKIVVIDHHRRTSDMGIKPVLVYIEAGASSTCELLTEMIPYVSGRVDISELDATMMLTGMIVDTNRYRVRTGARTYEAASALRQLGADPVKANDWLKDTFDEFSLKNAIMAKSENYPRGIVIVPIKDRAVTRSVMSQVADNLLAVQNVAAVFVIADVSDDQTAVSARSAGKINVQVIMEAMHGGGHMTAAALQRGRTPIDALKKELLAAIDTYFEEEVKDESDS